MQTASLEQLSPVAEPVRPHSLPVSSSNCPISRSDPRPQRSRTPPGNMSGHLSTLKPPPPLIQVSPSREKLYSRATEALKETSQSREGFKESESIRDRYPLQIQENNATRDVPRHPHTAIENKIGEREKRSTAVETVDLTRDKDSSIPCQKSAQVRSSARATLQAMAMSALAETKGDDVTETIPSKPPDTNLSSYEQSEAIRKFKALSNVCVSAAREFPGGKEYPAQAHGLMAMQSQAHARSNQASTSTPSPYPYQFPVVHSLPSMHHHPDYRMLFPVSVHQMPAVQDVLAHSVNGEEVPSHLRLAGHYGQYPHGADLYSGGMRPMVSAYQPLKAMSVCGRHYPQGGGSDVVTSRHTHSNAIGRHGDISEQDLANPFVVKPTRHTHPPEVSERVSPAELPRVPVPTHSPIETAKRSYTLSPELQAQHISGKVATSPPSSFLSRIPQRPVSVSEMRNRAAVIPDLKSDEALSSHPRFPKPQPAVLPETTRVKGDELVANVIQGVERETVVQHEAGSSLDEPTSAFATLVNVAAAARKVEVPSCSKEDKRSPQLRNVADQPGDTGLQRRSYTLVQEYPSSEDLRLADPVVALPMKETPRLSPTRVSPAISSTPRYGITTGLVPKPPPLMPITGLRTGQEGGGSSLPPLSVTPGGSGNVSRSPGKLSSPPGTRPARGSVSPEGPPPLIPRAVVSPNTTSISDYLPQGPSPKGPPPLIRGVASPAPGQRSPESDTEGSWNSRVNQEAVLRREPHVSEVPSQNAASSAKSTYQKQSTDSSDQSLALSSRNINFITANQAVGELNAAGQSQIRTIFETVVHLGPTHTVMQVPSESHRNPSESITAVHLGKGSPQRSLSAGPSFEEQPENKSDSTVSSSRSWWHIKDNTEQPLQSSLSSAKAGVSEGTTLSKEQMWVISSRESTRKEEMPTDCSTAWASLSPTVQSEPSAVTASSQGSDSETEEDVDVDLEDANTPVQSLSARLHPRVRALAGRGQSASHSLETSDSETLSAEESEQFPESSDEMFGSTTTKQGSHFDEGFDQESSGSYGCADSIADTTERLFAATSIQNPTTSRGFDDKEDRTDGDMPEVKSENQSLVSGHLASSLVTSSEPSRSQATMHRTYQTFKDSTSTWASLDADGQCSSNTVVPASNETADAGKEAEDPMEADLREEKGMTPTDELKLSQSFPPVDLVSADDSSEALASLVTGSSGHETLVASDSSVDNAITSTREEVDFQLLKTQSLDRHDLKEILDVSSSSIKVAESTVSEKTVSQDIRHTNADSAASAVQTTERAVSASPSNVEGNMMVSSRQCSWPDTVEVTPTELQSKTNENVSTSSDPREEEHEVESEETVPFEHDALDEADDYSSGYENHNPEISLVMDDVPDNNDLLPSLPTFIGQFIPQKSGIDSPERSGCSTQVSSERSSVCGEFMVPSEREMGNVQDVTPSQQVEQSLDVICPDEAVQRDETLSEGEIPYFQEINRTDDQVGSTKDLSRSGASSVLNGDQLQRQYNSEQSETAVPTDDHNQYPSQSKVEKDELSEGEIPESEDEAPLKPSTDSPPRLDPDTVTETQDSGDTDDDASSAGVLSPDITSLTDCYLDTVPISPAAPESPSQESEGDRVSPLPVWPATGSQAMSSSFVSLSLAARITAQRTAFPYSALSINVGSASSSARSSPVPQSAPVNLVQISSPGSSSLLVRPQEPTPLLSDNYEPLSDDDDGDIPNAS